MSSVAVLAVVILLASSAAGQPTLPNIGVSSGLDHCRVRLGTTPFGDGTFDQDANFTADILNGLWSLPDYVPLTGDDVFYVIPAQREAQYSTLAPGDTSADFCHNTATGLPQYNPLAVPIPANATPASLAVSQLSTVLVFGEAFGLDQGSLKTAFGVDPSIDITTYNAPQEFASDPTGPGGTFYKEDNKVEATVTLGSNLLSNNSGHYASFAVLLEQAIGRAALAAANNQYSSGGGGGTYAALDLNNPDVVNGIFKDAAGHVWNTRDYTFPNFLNQAPDSAYAATANATTNLADQIDSATTLEDIQRIQAAAESSIAPQVQELVEGQIDPITFLASTAPGAATYEGSVLAAPEVPDAAGSETEPSAQPTIRAPATIGEQTTQASTTSEKHHGLSGGAIAGIVIACVVGVALIAGLGLIGLKCASGQGQNGGSPHTPHTGIASLFGRIRGKGTQENINASASYPAGPSTL